jgi:hypothetical protein
VDGANDEAGAAVDCGAAIEAKFAADCPGTMTDTGGFFELMLLTLFLELTPALIFCDWRAPGAVSWLTADAETGPSPVRAMTSKFSLTLRTALLVSDCFSRTVSISASRIYGQETEK